MKRKQLILVYLCAAGLACFAQEKSGVRFGKVVPEDFKPLTYSIDTNASAVIIADIGSTEIEGNRKGWFSLVFKHYRRTRILNKNGYDAADVIISLFASGDEEEKLDDLKATTYNLENGKVVETKLDIKNGLFREKISKNLVRTKFTFPALKEGSIIEYEYRVKSDFLFNLQPWEFQGAWPRLWSEYNVTIPEFISYVFLLQGYQTPVKERKDTRRSFAVQDNTSLNAASRFIFSAAVSTYRWIMKDVPVLKEESFTSTLRNHISKVEFQLSEYREPLPPEKKIKTWEQFTEELLEADDFGAELDKDNFWIGDLLNTILHGETGPLDKARRIYSFVRDNFTATGYNGVLLTQPLRTIAKKREGTSAEINLLLIALLRYAGLPADPVILSTRDHGYTYADYPLLDKFNYIIAKTKAGKDSFYLDASDPWLGFGKLGYECYNGHARIINEDATPVEFSADSLLEKSITSVFVTSDDAGNLSGIIQQTPGYYESSRLRSVIKEKGRELFFAEIKKGFGADTRISDSNIDSLNQFDEPFNILYKFETKVSGEDIVYFNPMLAEGYKENPFQSATRLYPVEMPYATDETFSMQMEIPKGYEVDELPKEVIVRLNENNDGIFEYRISEVNGIISLRSRLRISHTFFLPDEYATLREFFNLVVKKHNEQIVFKKKK
jgi:Domain of Unknown Function with PDB structure (DUF3857)/Domain of Unknown Function with PDB structure (DUF3858)/Transglutaminase-like superfamily